MNIYYLQNPDGLAFGRDSDKALDVLNRNAHMAVNGKTETLKIPETLSSKRAGAIPVKARVKFIQNMRDDVTIIEIIGRDRPGLLYALATSLREAKLDILSAHIENVGEKAIDAFYIRPQDGERLTPKRQKIIKSQLMAVLEPASKTAGQKISA